MRGKCFGYVAHNFFFKYLYHSLKIYSLSLQTSWIQYLSNGNFSVPSKTRCNTAYALKTIIKELYGDTLANKKYIVNNKFYRSKLEVNFKNSSSEIIQFVYTQRHLFK